MVLVIKRLRQDYKLIDNIADIHICNDLKLMTDFIKKPSNVRGLMVDRIFLGYEIV